MTKIRSNPLFRAVRVDKMFYAALEATLLAYLREDYDSIPALRMMRLSDEELHSRAEHLMRKLHITNPQLHIEVVESRSVLGGGAGAGLDAADARSGRVLPVMSADAISAKLRQWVDADHRAGGRWAGAARSADGGAGTGRGDCGGAGES